MIHSSAEGGRRQRRRDARIEELLDHAGEIVVREGLDGLTVQRLAAEMDAAVGALYRYFPGKDALVAALQVRAVAAFGEFLESAIAAESEPLARVRAAARAWGRFAEVRPDLHALIDASLADPRPVLGESAAAEVAVALAPVLARVAGVLDEAVAAGVLGPGDGGMRTRALWAAMHGVEQLRKRDRLERAEYAADRVREVLIEALVAGWRR
jgi:AcrR family transcriptional regulator